MKCLPLKKILFSVFFIGINVEKFKKKVRQVILVSIEHRVTRK